VAAVWNRLFLVKEINKVPCCCCFSCRLDEGRTLAEHQEGRASAFAVAGNAAEGKGQQRVKGSSFVRMTAAAGKRRPALRSFLRQNDCGCSSCCFRNGQSAFKIQQYNKYPAAASPPLNKVPCCCLYNRWLSSFPPFPPSSFPPYNLSTLLLHLRLALGLLLLRAA
jgi:hypothetical protein